MRARVSNGHLVNAATCSTAFVVCITNYLARDSSWVAFPLEKHGVGHIGCIVVRKVASACYSVDSCSCFGHKKIPNGVQGVAFCNEPVGKTFHTSNLASLNGAYFAASSIVGCHRQYFSICLEDNALKPVECTDTSSWASCTLSSHLVIQMDCNGQVQNSTQLVKALKLFISFLSSSHVLSSTSIQMLNFPSINHWRYGKVRMNFERSFCCSCIA